MTFSQKKIKQLARPKSQHQPAKLFIYFFIILIISIAIYLYYHQIQFGQIIEIIQGWKTKIFSYNININNINQNTSFSDYIQKFQTTPNQKINEIIIQTGIIQKNSQLGKFTHYLINSGNKIGLKSKIIDLNEYSGTTQIKGILVDNTNINIVEVNEINSLSTNKSNSGNALNTAIVKGNNELIYNQKLGFYYNHEIYILTGTSNQKEFIIKDKLTGKPVITISPFVCDQKNIKLNCQQTEKTLIKNKNNNFISKYGVKYYEIIKKTKWVAFNHNLQGYYFVPTNENQIINFSKYFYFQKKNNNE